MGTDYDTLRWVVDKRGPAVACVEYGFEPGAPPHAVVVTGTDKDNVYVADPGTATECTVPVDQFRQDWESMDSTLYSVYPPWKAAKGAAEWKAPQQQEKIAQQRPAWRKRGR